jgi:tetratricopeptide (TPR) repeat protein
MECKQVIRAASGWLELGMPEDALNELKSLKGEDSKRVKVLELTLAAEMARKNWSAASESAIGLCKLEVDEPDYFLSAAFCLHEMGLTDEAMKWLLRGPDALSEMAVYHYNLACYLWKLNEKERARNHLSQAVEMDEDLMESARYDEDLVGMEL